MALQPAHECRARALVPQEDLHQGPDRRGESAAAVATGGPGGDDALEDAALELVRSELPVALLARRAAVHDGAAGRARAEPGGGGAIWRRQGCSCGEAVTASVVEVLRVRDGDDGGGGGSGKDADDVAGADGAGGLQAPAPGRRRSARGGVVHRGSGQAA